MFGKILQYFKEVEKAEHNIQEIIMKPLFSDEEIEEMSAFEWIKRVSTKDFIWYGYHKDKSVYAIIKFNDGIYELYTASESTGELVLRNRYIDLEAAQEATSRLYKNELIRMNRMFR